MLKENKWPKINLFKVRQHRGWWPFVSTSSTESFVLTGKVEAEFKLLSEKEAEEQPAGLGREAPDALPEPQ